MSEEWNIIKTAKKTSYFTIKDFFPQIFRVFPLETNVTVQ
jgi:hypothetical protein